MHAPPRGPTTHLAGILGQKGSTSYFGTVPSACTASGHNIADTVASMMAVATMTQWLIFFVFIFDLALHSIPTPDSRTKRSSEGRNIQAIPVICEGDVARRPEFWVDRKTATPW